jgi:hypothetical protein
MDKPKPKSLVEVLEKEAHRWRRLNSPLRRDENHEELAQVCDFAAIVAKPYEARRLALEKVAEAASAYLGTPSDFEKWEDLVSALNALAAVPPLPEEQ